MYTIGEKDLFFFFSGLGGGQAGFTSHDWTELAFLSFTVSCK